MRIIVRSARFSFTNSYVMHRLRKCATRIINWRCHPCSGTWYMWTPVDYCTNTWKFLLKDQSSECGYRRTSNNISGFFNNWKSTVGEGSFVNNRHSVSVTCHFLHELLKTFKSLWNLQTYFQRFHGFLRAVENSIPISHAWNVNVVNKGSWVVFHLLSGTQRCCD